MAQTTVSIRTLHGATAAVGWSNGRSVSIDRAEGAGGLGIGFNGGELLLLAVGGCYCNDLFREAAKMQIFRPRGPYAGSVLQPGPLAPGSQRAQ